MCSQPLPSGSCIKEADEDDELEKRAPSLLGDRMLDRSDDEATDDELLLVSASELQILQETFRLFDKDGDGCITTEELGTVLRCVGQSLSATQLKEVLRRIDKDGNGTIEFDEFIHLIKSERRRRSRQASRRAAAAARRPRSRSPANAATDDSDDELLAAFRVFDKDQNGYISAVELREVLSALGHSEYSNDEAQEMLREVDMNGDGLIDFQEFVAMMTNPTSRVPSRLSHVTDSTTAPAESAASGCEDNDCGDEDGEGDCDSTRACKSDG